MRATKCFANIHMKCDEFGFWEVCRSLSHPYGYKLIFDGRKLKGYFSEENKNHIYRMEKRLVKKGWFVRLKKHKRGSKGMWEPAEYQVLSHEEWVEKHSEKDCKASVPIPGPEGLKKVLGQSRNREQSSPGIGNSPVPKSGHSTAIEPISYTKAVPATFRADPEEELKTGVQKTLCGSANVPPVPESGLVTGPEGPASELNDFEKKEERRALFEHASKHGGISPGQYQTLREEFERDIAATNSRN